MTTKSRESIYGASVRAAAENAARARKTADRLACEAWNKRMLGFQGPAQSSPALVDAINSGLLNRDSPFVETNHEGSAKVITTQLSCRLPLASKLTINMPG